MICSSKRPALLLLEWAMDGHVYVYLVYLGGKDNFTFAGYDRLGGLSRNGITASTIRSNYIYIPGESVLILPLPG